MTGSASSGICATVGKDGRGYIDKDSKEPNDSSVSCTGNAEYVTVKNETDSF